METIKILFSFIISFAVASAKFQDICYSSHNRLRSLHINTHSLEWDDELAASAEAWAEHLASIKAFKGDPRIEGTGIVENFYGSVRPKLASCAEAALQWYNEYNNYDYESPLKGSKCTIAHFAKLVWKSSMRLGVGVASFGKGSNMTTVIVARYSPIKGLRDNNAYLENVMKWKNPHTKVPTKYDLDPSLCYDSKEEVVCKEYESYDFCNPANEFYKDMKYLCAKTCKIC